MQVFKPSLYLPLASALVILMLVINHAEAAEAPVGDAGIGAQRMMKHIEVLSSDEFEGRLPATVGETKTVAYLTEQFKALGLQPGNPDGSFVQAVPLVGISGTPTLSIEVAGRELPMNFRTDYVATTSRSVPEVKIGDSQLVFVGYGVQAPEYSWDDYKGLDVRGKTLVMLVNDPAVPDPRQAGQLDNAFFKGTAMTYYGRWTYKYEIGSKLGADAVLIVHETEPAGYGWNVVEHSWTGEAFELAEADRNADRVPVQGWITLDKAKALFAQSGLDFDRLKTAAAKRDFKPVALDARLTANIRNQVREVQSQNVLARLPGSDPARANEYVIYTAHWDHLGKDTSLQGDQIHNGAVDNASGIAGLLEIAHAFTRTNPKPARSILFLAVTAEEQGLLGSKYYAEHPLYPLDKTLGNINMDSINVWGPTQDVQVVGYGQNTLEDQLGKVVKARQRVVVADTEPQKGRYFRSDQFSFAKVGVPGLYVKGGVDMRNKPPGWGQAKLDEYTAKNYHAPSDEIESDWDLRGAVEDMQMLYAVGQAVAGERTWPAWKTGSEFKKIREESFTARRDKPASRPRK